MVFLGFKLVTKISAKPLSLTSAMSTPTKFLIVAFTDFGNFTKLSAFGTKNDHRMGRNGDRFDVAVTVDIAQGNPVDQILKIWTFPKLRLGFRAGSRNDSGGIGRRLLTLVNEAVFLENVFRVGINICFFGPAGGWAAGGAWAAVWVWRPNILSLISTAIRLILVMTAPKSWLWSKKAMVGWLPEISTILASMLTFSPRTVRLPKRTKSAFRRAPMLRAAASLTVPDAAADCMAASTSARLSTSTWPSLARRVESMSNMPSRKNDRSFSALILNGNKAMRLTSAAAAV